MVRYGAAWLGKAGFVGLGGHGPARSGAAWQGSAVEVRQGAAWHGSAVEVRRGLIHYGQFMRLWLVEAGRGMARRGGPGVATPGRARYGLAV